MRARSMRQSLAALSAAGLAALLSAPVLAGDVEMLEPKWDDPEVKAYLESTPRVAPEAAAGPKDELRLPVLELKEPPENVRSTMGAAAEAASEPEIIYDPDNPVWYQATHNYGDVTVTIEADLRVRTAAPGTEVFEKEGISPEATDGPDVSIYADAEAEGTPGYVAEYTIEKFGVPYTVRVECTATVKEECADKAKVAATAALLTIKGGNPAK